MSSTAAWMVLIFGYMLPLAHVVASPAGGAWLPPAGARCPLGPRNDNNMGSGPGP